jgi:hypothetical protein
MKSQRPGHRLLHVQLRHIGTALGELLGVRLDLAEDLREQHPADVQPLLHERDQLGVPLLRLPREPVADPPTMRVGR